METIRDYIGFAARFTGLIYVVAYVLTAPEAGAPLAALLPAAAVPPGLHLMDAIAAGFVAAQGLFAVVRPAPPVAANAPAASPGPANVHIPLRRRVPSLPPIKARSHFGLRGVPH